jgi:hypothetical protein
VKPFISTYGGILLGAGYGLAMRLLCKSSLKSLYDFTDLLCVIEQRMKKVEFNPKGQLTIEQVYTWMDGGSVTLATKDKKGNAFSIEFVQKVSLQKEDYAPCPGSLLLNKNEIEVRSQIESKILSSLQQAVWGPAIVEAEKQLLSQIIGECIEFVTSDAYLEVAKKLNRIK